MTEQKKKFSISPPVLLAALLALFVFLNNPRLNNGLFGNNDFYFFEMFFALLVFLCFLGLLGRLVYAVVSIALKKKKKTNITPKLCFELLVLFLSFSLLFVIDHPPVYFLDAPGSVE